MLSSKFSLFVIIYSIIMSITAYVIYKTKPIYITNTPYIPSIPVYLRIINKGRYYQYMAMIGVSFAVFMAILYIII